jgi:hypothetical protein
MKIWLAFVLSLVSVAIAAADEAPPQSLAAAVAAYAASKRMTQQPSYSYALVDLNGDRRKDAVVLLTGPDWCGSGGCTMLVLRATARGFVKVSGSTLSSAPIRVSKEKSHGWRNLIVDTRDKDALMRFDGRRYPLNPSMEPAASKAQIAASEIVIAEQSR